jgi:Holliday junction resolvasome RuvABC endonuclease subunit
MTDSQISLPVPASAPGMGRHQTHTGGTSQPGVRAELIPAGGGETAAGMGPRVIGLDLAAESTGVALPDGTTFTIKAPRAKGKKRTLADDLARLDHIADYIAAVLTHPADLIVIEDYAAGIRSAAAHRLAEVGGVVRLACHRAGVPIALVNNMHLKIYATGTTKAEKGDMRMAAYKRAGVEFANDDECDGWWLRAMGLDHLGHPVVDLPKVQRAALYPKTKKDVWPELVIA